MTAVLRRVAAAAVPPLGFLLLAIGIYGRGVVASPSATVVGDDGADKTIAMWSLAWWPHALARGRDPFSADVVWAPHGIDLSWVTAIPGPALVAAPLTLGFGPVIAYNTLALAAPALAAWTTFLLARALGTSIAAAVVAGFVFGFSPFQTNHTVGHLNLTLTFLIPICGLLAVGRYHGRHDRRAYVLLQGVVLAGQFLISIELFLLLVLSAATFSGLALWRTRTARRILRVAAETAAAAVVALLLVSPYLFHALVIAGVEHQPVRSPAAASIDVANVIVPTRRVLLRPPGSEAVVERFAASPVERTGYLGLPLLVALVLAARDRRRTALDSLLVLCAVILAVASFGPRIRFSGESLAPGPWLPFAHLPILDGALPARFSVFVFLLAALVLARWLTRRPSRWLLGMLVVVSLTPVFTERLWTANVPRPSFFTSERDARHLQSDDTALVFPYGPVGWSLLWQAEAGFRFRLVGGHFGRRATPDEEEWRDFHHGLAGGPLPAGGTRRFRRFLVAHDVDVIVTTPGTRPGLRRLVRSLGLSSVRSGDATVYRR